MAYTVNNFDGTFLTTVADGTIDATTDIRFVGKNYAGYGEIQNENFLHLMENFSGTTAPPKKVVGQLWYDATGTVKKLKFWDGTTWRNTSGATSAATAPAGLMPGEFWWDTSKSLLKVWNGTTFTTIGPSSDPEYNRLETITTSDNKTLVAIKDNGQIVAIFSSYDTFVPTPAITNFPTIYKGITLSGVDTRTDPLWTSGESVHLTTAYKLVATASNSDALGGIPASEFTRLRDGIFTGIARFSDNGYTLGNENNLHVRYDRANLKLLIETTSGEAINFKVGSNEIVAVVADGVRPSVDNTYKLGALAKRWSEVHAVSVTADTLNGNLTGNVTGDLTGNVRLLGGSDIIVNAQTNTIGTENLQTIIRGRFQGSFEGDLTGIAENSLALDGYRSSKSVNETTSVIAIEGNTVPVRTTQGDIYARNFVATGSVNKASTLAFDGSFFAASSIVPAGAEKRSIVARDTAGDISARLFSGTATSARYADLAEKYLPDANYEIGTVMVVGGEAEVTASQWGDRAIGVVSENPAFMMNRDLEGGIYIALKGRVPVKVSGAVKKGQRLIAGKDGVAVPAVPHANDVFAIALESNDETGVKLIEAVIL